MLALPREIRGAVMTDSERRYGPTIDLQGFDLNTQLDTVDEPSRLPLLVVMALVVLAAFAGVVWLAYTQGVERGRESVSRELLAQSFWKVRKPEGPAYTGLKIYEPATPDHATAAPAGRPANAIPALRPTAGAAPENAANAQKSLPGTTGVPPALLEGKGGAAVPAAVPENAGATPAVPGTATRAPTELTQPAAGPLPTLTHPITGPESLPPASLSKPVGGSSSPKPAAASSKPLTSAATSPAS